MMHNFLSKLRLSKKFYHDLICFALEIYYYVTKINESDNTHRLSNV